MKLNTSYNQIWRISAPIMLGSAAQNIVALSDSVFLFHLSKSDFAAIGFVGVFYLVVAAIGYGFSKGGQIMIARRAGEGALAEVGRTFYSLVYFEMGLALVLFLFLRYGSDAFFGLMVDSPIIHAKSLEYLDYRSWGVFFSYVGVAIIALYTGIAKTTFIIVDTIILGVVNIVLNYALIFGHWGFPAMGIGGAALASTIAEIVAFGVFVIYMLLDKSARQYRLFALPKVDWLLIRQQYQLSAPIVAQAIVGLGSWFVFFGLVENLGERELAMSNLIRMVYLALSVPVWGFSSGINTLVSNFVGQQKRQAVIPIIWKTAKVCLLVTLLLSLPVVLFPQQLLYPFLGGADMSLVADAQPIFYILLGILGLFSIGAIFFNGLAGVGATRMGLKIQFVSAVGYLVYIYVVIYYTSGGLLWAWASEIFYWIVVLVWTIWYLKSKDWYGLRV